MRIVRRAAPPAARLGAAFVLWSAGKVVHTTFCLLRRKQVSQKGRVCVAPVEITVLLNSSEFVVCNRRLGLEANQERALARSLVQGNTGNVRKATVQPQSGSNTQRPLGKTARSSTNCLGLLMKRALEGRQGTLA